MKRIPLLAVLLMPVLLLGCSQPRPVVYAPPPPALTLPQITEMGFRDGFAAARRDVATGRPPMPRRHPRFRNPPVPPEAIPDYRRAFRNGYARFLHPTPPPPPGAGA